MYLVTKDGLWLMNWQPSGHMEVVADGPMVDVPICLWGEDIHDAKGFEERSTAAFIAKVVGATLMNTEKG